MVGETPGFAERGGIIRFTLEDNRVRFEINVDAAHQADLNISSRLLTLAKSSASCCPWKESRMILQNLSIKRKLTLITMLTSSAALILSA